MFWYDASCCLKATQEYGLISSSKLNTLWNLYNSLPVDECNAVPRPVTEEVTKESECHKVGDVIPEAVPWGDHHQYQGFQGHHWVGLLQGLCQWCPFQNGYAVGAAPLISWCLKGLLSISAFLSPSFSSMDMSLKLSTHFSALMLFQPRFFLFLLLLLEAFTNTQVRWLRNFHRACVQNRSKDNW